MLHNPFSTPMPATRPTLQLPSPLHTSHIPTPSESFSDARTHGYRGPSRSVTLQNASSRGGSAISKSQDGERCVVAGKDSLRILRVSEPSEKSSSDHKFAIGRGGHKIDASRNLWSGSGLKVDSAMTDVVWCHKAFDTKILTSARNGELIVWDLNKSGSTKYERKIKGHMRSINKLSYSPAMPNYCSTGSSDGNLRVWDLRDLSKASHYIHHTFAIRTVIALSDPLHAITGLDNGTMCHWDLRMGQKGQLERVPLAHTGPILSLDWRDPQGVTGDWLASAGYDRTVKVWDFSEGSSSTLHSSTRKPDYVLHTAYPVRKVVWRPGYETELAIASNNESGFSLSSKSVPSASVTVPNFLNKEVAETVTGQTNSGSGDGVSLSATLGGSEKAMSSAARNATSKSGDMIEIWDVRRAWIAKWTIDNSSCEGGVSDMTFADSHALWVQHPSGAFSQMDLRNCNKPVDSVPRTALTWTPTGSLTFVNDSPARWEVPYDDTAPTPKTTSSPERTPSHKKLGDVPYIPTTQCLGTLLEATVPEEWDVFDFLARGYKIEGADQTTLCEINSEVAFEAGNDDAGRMWLLLHSLLTDLTRTQTPPLPPEVSALGLPHSVSAPSAIPSVKKSPTKYAPTRSSSSDPFQSSLKNGSGHDLEKAYESPAHRPAMARSVTGHEGGKRSVPPDEHFMTRGQSVNVATLARPRRQSLRHASISTSSTSASRTNDRSSSSRTRRLRQIGEGALGDSDSSETGARDVVTFERRKEILGPRRNSTDTFNSPAAGSSRPQQVPKRIISSPGLPEDNDWAEDEKEEDSVSPASSSGPESDDSIASTTAARSSSLKRPAVKSRSSTLAPPIRKLRNRSIPRTDSRSSVLTITASGDKSFSHDPFSSEAAADKTLLANSPKSQKRQSQVFSVSRAPPPDKELESMDENEMRFLQWNQNAITEAEERYRTKVWEALKAILEELADNGDVQMCAMLACIVPSELGIQTWRALQFIEAYIDVLSRLRMHSVAAYIRKFAPSSEVRQSSQVQTTIYTVCATCRKPIVQPAIGEPHSSGRSWTGFSQCFECKKVAIKCTICHLPVRSALFVCAVCSHGGHQRCYHRYYMQRPMIELSTSTLEPRGRRATRVPGPSTGEVDGNLLSGEGPVPPGAKSVTKYMGHPCAAGCGHFCWTASNTFLA
ncbi:hypothetical protein M0805_002561 [Coniferiporia weirii]|nr:hypothetical protein M0805_002561 [Coniferiporia weirii]